MILPTHKACQKVIRTTTTFRGGMSAGHRTASKPLLQKPLAAAAATGPALPSGNVQTHLRGVNTHSPISPLIAFPS